MERNHPMDAKKTKEAVHLQAELPTAGTALNPLEEEWAFDQNQATAPVNKPEAGLPQEE